MYPDLTLARAGDLDGLARLLKTARRLLLAVVAPRLRGGRGVSARVSAREVDFGEAELSDPALYSDAPERIPALTTAFDQAGQQVETLYARWAELEAIREAQ